MRASKLLMLSSTARVACVWWTCVCVCGVCVHMDREIEIEIDR